MIQIPAGIMLTIRNAEGEEEHFPAIIRLHVVIHERPDEEGHLAMSLCMN